MRARPFVPLAILALALATAPAAPAAPPPGCSERAVVVEKLPVAVSICVTGFTGIVDDVVSANGRSITHGLAVGGYGAAPGGREPGGSQETRDVAPAAAVPSAAPTGTEGNVGAATASDTVDLTELGFPKRSLRLTFSLHGFDATVTRVVLEPEGLDL